VSGEPIVTLIGHVGADPEIRYVASGTPVCNFNLAVTPRTLNRQTNQWENGTTAWYRCTIWREHGEHVAETIQKGMRVIVTGRLTVRTYEHDGAERTALEVAVDEIGPTLRYATAHVTKTTNTNGQAHSQVQGQAGDDYDPWAGQTNTPSGSAFDTTLPPF